MIAADPVYTLEAIVPNGGTESNLVELNGHALIGVATPGALTSTTGELQTSIASGSFLPVYDREDTKYTLALGTNRYIALPPGDIAGLHNVRLKVGSAEGADRTFKLLVRKLG